MFLKTPKNVYDTIHPIFYVSKILGLAPLSLKKSKLTRQIGPITIARLILITAALIYAIYELDHWEFPDSTSGIAVRVELITSVMMAVVHLLGAILQSKGVVKILEHIDKVDKYLNEISIKVDYTKARRVAYLEILAVSCMFAIKLIVQNYSYEGFLLLSYTVVKCIDYLNTLILFQYVNVFMLLSQRYDYLNAAIQNMDVARNENCRPEDLIVHYGKIHNELYVIGLKHNRLYEVQIFTSVLGRFVLLTMQMIYLYKFLQNGDLRIGRIVLLFIYVFLHSLKLLMVAGITENTASKGQDTALYLHRLNYKSEEFGQKVDFFSLQVLHQNPSYSACGFFNLDFKLLSSITGAITTYLIITIQFDK